ncbi:putative phytanoyl-CoA dioxygenase [Nocardioides sp. PD653]|nr:Putative phytanoyl-CoA dioxygenase [Nocardioides sp. PD653-B2]GAW54821.1 putative phytanoyl-CoA dioxygenase [Nocardioides sp. PD653]
MMAEAVADEARWADLDELGYVVLPGHMDDAWRTEAAATFDRLIEAQTQTSGGEGLDTLTVGGVERGAPRLWNCVTKGEVFDRAYLDPTVLAAAEHVIGRPFKLHSFNARDVLQGEGHQDLHADMERSSADEPYSSINTLWLLDDFTADNGATRLVPGSHRRWGAVSEQVEDLQAAHPDEIRVIAPAGTLVVFNSHIWHGGTRNDAGTRRRVLHVSYVARELPQQVSQRDEMTPETLARLTPDMRHLLDV